MDEEGWEYYDVGRRARALSPQLPAQTPFTITPVESTLTYTHLYTLLVTNQLPLQTKLLPLPTPSLTRTPLLRANVDLSQCMQPSTTTSTATGTAN